MLSLFRFITGLLLFQYGIAKDFQVSGGRLFRQHPAVDHGGRPAIELILGALLMIGLFSRIVAFILAG